MQKAPQKLQKQKKVSPRSQKKRAVSTKVTKKVAAKKTTAVVAPIVAQATRGISTKISAPKFTQISAPVISAPKTTLNFKLAPLSTQLRGFRTTPIAFAEPEKKQIKEYLEVTLTSPNVTPYYKQKAHAVYVATTHGERGILRNASAMIATLRPGVCKVYEDAAVTDPKKFFLPSGVVRIANDDKALEITASEIIPVEELDGEAAKKLLETATAAAASATDAAVKAQHTITMRVANAIVKATEKYSKA